MIVDGPVLGGANSTNTSSAVCPAGTRVLGGGYNNTGSFISSSVPDSTTTNTDNPNGLGWSVKGSNGLFNPDYFEAFAICANVP